MTTGATIYELDIPDVPPSMNRFGFGGKGTHMKFHRLKRTWEEMIVTTLREAQVPKALRRVQASAKLRFTVKRKRDEGNFRWLLEKALGDALQVNGNLADDSPEEFTFGALSFDPVKGQPRTIITLEAFRD